MLRALAYLWHCLTHMCPLDLFDWRNGHFYKCHIILALYLLRTQLFSVAQLTRWNSLPIDSIQTPSLHSFQHWIHSYLDKSTQIFRRFVWVLICLSLFYCGLNLLYVLNFGCNFLFFVNCFKVFPPYNQAAYKIYEIK